MLSKCLDGPEDGDGDVYQPSSTGTVKRKRSTIDVPCPESIIHYSQFMGGVDRRDQLRGFYRCKSKSRKYYKYFLFNVEITNAYILVRFLSLQGLQVLSASVGERPDRGVLHEEVAEGRSSTSFPSSRLVNGCDGPCHP